MGRILGIDFGGTKILAGVVDTHSGEVLSHSKRRTVSQPGHTEALNSLSEAIEEALKDAGVSGKTMEAVGIGVAGQVDAETNELTRAPNLPQELLGNAIVKAVGKDCGGEVRLFNDVAAAAAGEAAFGAGKGQPNFVCIFVGTGIGGAIYRDGKPYLGSTNTAGEIGHTTIDFDGRLCGCGGKGHLEAYASRTAVVRTILAGMKQGRASTFSRLVPDPDPNDPAHAPIRSKALRKAVEEGDALTIDMIDDAARHMAAGLSSVVNFYNPPLIVLGGGMVDAVDRYFDRAASHASQEALRVPGSQVQIVKAALGDYSGIVGAAVLAEAAVTRKR
jgi:glucokinase